MSTTDYTSPASQYEFAEILAEQEVQLKENPTLQRMMASRKEMASDRYRPVYHYVNPENRMNDPNGLCPWRGRDEFTRLATTPGTGKL